MTHDLCSELIRLVFRCVRLRHIISNRTFTSYHAASRHVMSCYFFHISPADLHANLEEGEIILEVQLSGDQPNQACYQFGEPDYDHYSYPEHPVRTK